MINNSEEVEKFLNEHKSPAVINASTIKDGFVSCINPVPTICGAELHVNPKTRPELIKFMQGFSEPSPDDLLPCPFCGGEPELVDLAGWEIWCKCGLCLILDSPEKAPLIKQWNTRTNDH